MLHQVFDRCRSAKIRAGNHASIEPDDLSLAMDLELVEDIDVVQQLDELEDFDVLSQVDADELERIAKEPN